MTHAIRIVPLPPRVVAEVRMTYRAPRYGPPAHREIAMGTGPCRACLTTFAIGADARILFTYNPFSSPDTYPSPGPVFIHATECATCSPDVVPDSLRTLPLLVEGYGSASLLVARARVADGDIESTAARLLGLEAVEYAHVRHAEAGCFIARIERPSEV